MKHRLSVGHQKKDSKETGDKSPLSAKNPSLLRKHRWKLAMLLLLLLIASLTWAILASKHKSTDHLLEALRGTQERDRLIAVRLLPKRQGSAAQVVPALIESLKDKDSSIRISAALGLGSFGGQATDAIAALQTAQHDRDARVRQAAGKALSRIDPDRFPASSKEQPSQEK